MTIKLKTLGLLCVLVLSVVSCSTEMIKQSDVTDEAAMESDALENRETAKASDTALKMGNDAHEKGDYATAVEMYRKAAEQGYANAQYNLGVMYHMGQGVKNSSLLY
jgi:TPR repeat protein